MAERKTAEIKFRIEPSRKARFQQAAADEGIGLSEFIVNSCEAKVEEARVLGSVDGLMQSAGFAAPSSNPFADIPSATTPDAAPTKCGDGAVQESKPFGNDWKPWS